MLSGGPSKVAWRHGHESQIQDAIAVEVPPDFGLNMVRSGEARNQGQVVRVDCIRLLLGRLCFHGSVGLHGPDLVLTGRASLACGAAQVAEATDFDPSSKNRVNRPPFASITLKGAGKTDKPLWTWSGDVLMDLTKFQALKMETRKLDGKDYLFVETGGFGTRKKPGWKSQLLVLTR